MDRDLKRDKGAMSLLIFHPHPASPSKGGGEIWDYFKIIFRFYFNELQNLFSAAPRPRVKRILRIFVTSRKNFASLRFLIILRLEDIPKWYKEERQKIKIYQNGINDSYG